MVAWPGYERARSQGGGALSVAALLPQCCLFAAAAAAKCTLLPFCAAAAAAAVAAAAVLQHTTTLAAQSPFTCRYRPVPPPHCCRPLPPSLLPPLRLLPLDCRTNKELVQRILQRQSADKQQQD